MDTVHPVGLFGTPPVKQEGDKIYGPGVVDCKGGIVAAFFAMRTLNDCRFTLFEVTGKAAHSGVCYKDELLNHLKNGGEVIANVSGDREGCVGVFTQRGHYILVLAVENNTVCIFGTSMQ